MLSGSQNVAPLTTRASKQARMSRRMALCARLFVRDVRGVAAVEFGFIAPILLVMLLGTVELTRAIAIDRRFSQVTTTVADLITREEALTANDVRAIYDVAAQIMRPYESTPMKLSIYPVKSKNGVNIVYPVTTNRPAYNGGTVPARCAQYPLAENMLDPTQSESVVVVEGEYRFSPMFAGFLMSGVNWHHKAFAKPRKSAFVDFGDKQGTC